MFEASFRESMTDARSKLGNIGKRDAWQSLIIGTLACACLILCDAGNVTCGGLATNADYAKLPVYRVVVFDAN